MSWSYGSYSATVSNSYVLYATFYGTGDNGVFLGRMGGPISITNCKYYRGTALSSYLKFPYYYCGSTCSTSNNAYYWDKLSVWFKYL